MNRTAPFPTVFSRTPGNGLGTAAPSLADAGYEVLVERRAPGTIRRTLAILRHALGLWAGHLVDWTRSEPKHRRFGLRWRRRRVLAALLSPFVGRAYRREPFAVQLRLRLERLGPTFVKLGQVLSLREDLLPCSITDELRQLLDRLPAVPFPRFLELVAVELGRPLDEVFAWIEPVPAGSASIAQVHRARTIEGETVEGEEVILKVVKPGILDTLERDARVLDGLGRLGDLFYPRLGLRRVLAELTELTLREADLSSEAENAEIFAAHFRDEPDVRFPGVHRELSTSRLLTMEAFEGFRPDAPEALEASEEARARLLDLGVGAIIRMFFRDGFFHADLHPANLRVLPGPRAGFLDLGMVGRFDAEMRRTLLYYYYCLVNGDATGAARYLATVARPARGGDPEAFRREVETLSQRFHRAPGFQGVSFGRLIVESVNLGRRHGMTFPVELVLMAKALVTFEAVGRGLDPDLDVAALSKPHLQRILLERWSPIELGRGSLHEAPEWLDAVVRLPMLVREGLETLERRTRQPTTNPLSGVPAAIFGGLTVLAGALLAGQGLDWTTWMPFVVAGAAVAWKGRG